MNGPDMTEPPAAEARADERKERRASGHLRGIKLAVTGVLIVHLLGVLYFAKSMVLPVVMAMLLSLILSPVVRFLKRRHVPESASAVLVVMLLTGAVGGAVYGLSEPASNWLANAPSIAAEIRYKLTSYGSPVEQVKQAAKQVEQATESDDGEAERVVVKEPGLVARAASGAPEVVGAILVTIVLLFFMLAAGDSFYAQLVRALPRFRDRKTGLRIAEEVERDVSRYLFTIAAVNCALGCVIGLGMYAIGMPNPVLWGVAAALLNFAPYLGPLVGIVMVSAVAFVSLEPLGHAALAPAIYFGANLLEGQFITPALLGRRLKMNALAVFLSILFWGWMWGPVGVLLAVPLLIVVRVFAEHTDYLGAMREFLSRRPPVERSRGLGNRPTQIEVPLHIIGKRERPETE